MISVVNTLKMNDYPVTPLDNNMATFHKNVRRGKCGIVVMTPNMFRKTKKAHPPNISQQLFGAGQRAPSFVFRLFSLKTRSLM